MIHKNLALYSPYKWEDVLDFHGHYDWCNNIINFGWKTKIEYDNTKDESIIHYFWIATVNKLQKLSHDIWNYRD